MGVCYSNKAFEISRETKERMDNEHFYINMECGRIIFDDEIPNIIKNARECCYEWSDFEDCSDKEILNELSIVDIDAKDDYCYGIGVIDFFKTSSGDIVCIVNYAW